MVDSERSAADEPNENRWRSALRAHLPLVPLLGLAAVVYVAASWYQWVDLDEGLYLGAALSVVHGNVPFVSFAAREPVLIYWLALGISLFGPSLFVGRLMVDALFLIAGAGVYAVGSRVVHPWAGIAAAAMFLFNPFDVYYGSIIAIEAAVAAPLAWSVFFLFRSRAPSSLDLFLSGLLLGVAVLTLRDSVVLAPLVLGVVLWQYRGTAKDSFRPVGAWILGAFLTLGTVLLTFVSLTSLSWMWTELGPSPSYFNHAQPFAQRLATLGYAAAFEPWLLVLVVLAPGAVLIASGYRWWGSRLGEASAVVVIALPWLAITYFSYGSGDLLFSGLVLLGILLLFSWLGGLRALDRLSPASFSDSQQLPLLVFCIAWIVLDVLVDALLSANYFAHRILELSLPGSLIGGLLLFRFLTLPQPEAGAAESPPSSPEVPEASLRRWHIGTRQRTLAVAITVLLVGSALFSAVAVLGPSNPYNEPYATGVSTLNANQRVYAISELNDVAHYLDQNSPARATLFSGDVAFLTVADRPNLLNLSVAVDLYNRPMTFNSSPLGSAPGNLAPSWSEIFHAWNSTYVPLVVVGPRTVDIESNFPYLASYIALHYALVATFGDQGTPSAVQVWKLGGPPVAGTLTARSAGPGTNVSSTAYLSSTDLVAVSAWNSRTVMFYEGASLDPCGNYTIPAGVAGVRFLAYDQRTTELWIGSLGKSVVVLQVSSACVANREFALNLSAAPTALAFDPALGSALIIEAATSLLVVVNDTTGDPTSTLVVVASPSAMAVAPEPNTVYVASGSTTYLASYDLTTGNSTGRIDLGFEANNVLVTSAAILVTWAAPGMLEWLNRSTGVPIASIEVGAQAEGFATEGGTVAVGSFVTGVVSLFNISAVTPLGFLSTNGCPASIGFVLPLPQVVLGGACGTSTELWTLQSPVTLSLGSVGASNTLLLDGLTVRTPVQLQLLPGYYWFNVSGPGFVGQSTQLAISADTSWTPGPGASDASVTALQETFVAVSAAGAVIAAVLCLTFPPPPEPVSRRRP